MDKINEGGSAFPVPADWDGKGMTLRDYFAAKAMQGELAAQDERNHGKGTGILTPDSMNEFAKRCYEIADAMLAARK
jgi:hypothetical protein